MACGNAYSLTYLDFLRSQSSINDSANLVMSCIDNGNSAKLTKL